MFISRFHNFVLAATLTSLLAVTGCVPKLERPDPIRGGTEHLLLLHDRELRYQERHGVKEKSYTEKIYYSGGKRIKVYDAVFKGLDQGVCSFLSYGSRVTFSTTQPLTYSAKLPEYRQCWVDEDAKQGDSWEDPDMGTQTLFAGYESVTVPAGTFDRCYKTVTTALPGLQDSLRVARERGTLSGGDVDKVTENSKLVIVRWFASGVGLVKEQLGGSDYVRELVEVVQPGVGKVVTDSVATP